MCTAFKFSFLVFFSHFFLLLFFWPGISMKFRIDLCQFLFRELFCNAVCGNPFRYKVLDR